MSNSGYVSYLGKNEETINGLGFRFSKASRQFHDKLETGHQLQFHRCLGFIMEQVKVAYKYPRRVKVMHLDDHETILRIETVGHPWAGSLKVTNWIKGKDLSREDLDWGHRQHDEEVHEGKMKHFFHVPHRFTETCEISSEPSSDDEKKEK
ncbi:MAG: hypothetical protein Q9162_000765 [Coniocarpon cinnabarinum]